MITDNEKEIILKCAEKYNVSALFLFRSSLEKEKYNDIDIGVKGIKSGLFFKFYAKLVRNLPKMLILLTYPKNH